MAARKRGECDFCELPDPGSMKQINVFPMIMMLVIVLFLIFYFSKAA